MSRCSSQHVVPYLQLTSPSSCCLLLPSLPHLLIPLQATVFAVYDEARIMQYVGFSRGLRDTLRTLFSRRPDKAHYYK
jgi:hypothetical protein